MFLNADPSLTSRSGSATVILYPIISNLAVVHLPWAIITLILQLSKET